MATKALVTAEQLPALVAGRRAELIRGEVVELVPVGRKHSRFVKRLLRRIDDFTEERHMGEAGTEAGFVLSRDPDVVRAPDIFYMSAARLQDAPQDGYFEGAPDLAIEVLSPDDRASDVQEMIREYLEAGSRLVWVVDPRTETVTAHQPSGDAHTYAGDEAVPGDPVLPGFSFRLADLFRAA